MVHGRDRELRVIAHFATDLDPTVLVVRGLSGIGKTATVLQALRQVGAGSSAVRVVRPCSSRPSAHDLDNNRRIDLSTWSIQDSESHDPEFDATGFMRAVSVWAGDSGPGPRVLFVDDVGVLTPERARWLQHLADEAYGQDWRVIAAVRSSTVEPLSDDVEVLELGPLDRMSLRRVLDTELSAPVAADVVERLRWWSAGNPRLALELAGALSAAELCGDVAWTGPDDVGSAARRAYRTLLAGLDPATTAALADAPLGRTSVVRRDGRATVRHPLLALLCREARGADGTGREAQPLDRDVTAPGAVVNILDGLHLDELPARAWAAVAAAPDPRLAARAVGVSLLAGRTWRDHAGGPLVPDGVGADWTDHLWWRDPAGAGEAARAAGARVAETLLCLEDTGDLADPGALRADLRLIGPTPGQDWVGVGLQVRGLLMLGDVVSARDLLADHSGTAPGRTVAEIVARDLAAARVAAFDGRAADVRAHLAHAAELRPAVDGWLPARGMRAAADAVVDGTVPASTMPAQAGTWSARVLGEYAADLGAAHLVAGQAEGAAALLTIALEHCAWPYRGRVQVRCDLVEAVLASTSPGKVGPRAQRLLDPPLVPGERSAPDVAAAYSRLCALLADDGAPSAAFEAALHAPPAPMSPWQRARMLVAYGRYAVTRGSRATGEAMLDEARTLVRLAGMAGWLRGIDVFLAEAAASGGTGPEWEVLGGHEREMVRLAVHGATNSQIAQATFVSERTVVNRLRRAYATLGIRDRRDLVRLAETRPPAWLAGG
ncbi:regulatory protein, luxR family [Promicromonospora umidemergens]|uniref:HTH luxR-type domain-containing protein n=1 Tax=Promicromonospora umidemergens TaxID=629679 RepID=A0ABP8Y560_9MICO|nr:LuxR C-terminal-related transcriptional regulator [Promicromonospora umidemergens]MCP2282648.1 regulatory protein, luxR family [Promicromonospora umidemergens]